MNSLSFLFFGMEKIQFIVNSTKKIKCIKRKPPPIPINWNTRGRQRDQNQPNNTFLIDVVDGTTESMWSLEKVYDHKATKPSLQPTPHFFQEMQPVVGCHLVGAIEWLPSPFIRNSQTKAMSTKTKGRRGEGRGQSLPQNKQSLIPNESLGFNQPPSGI